MKRIKYKVMLFLGFLTIIASIQPAFALNQYSVNPGAHFRWDATKYIFIRDGLGLGINLEYTHSYYLEFDFTNWAGMSGMEYLNGTYNNNGTVYDWEISHEYYYDNPPGQNWATVILNVGVATYPVHIYLVCNTEIEQTTKPDMQNLDTNSWINFTEPSTNNFTLSGTYPSGIDRTTYTAFVEFNSDKVLKYVFDEVVQVTSDITMSITRYIWSLTYTPGTDTGNGDTNGIPGFSLYIIIFVVGLGIIITLSKKNYFKTKIY